MIQYKFQKRQGDFVSWCVLNVLNVPLESDERELLIRVINNGYYHTDDIVYLNTLRFNHLQKYIDAHH